VLFRRALLCCFVVCACKSPASNAGSPLTVTLPSPDGTPSSPTPTHASAAVLGPSTSANVDTSAGTIPWLRDLDAGWAEAEKRGRPLLIYVRAAWKPACLEVERTTLLRASVVRAARPYVPVFVDLDDQQTLTRVEARVSAEAVSRLPSFVLIDTKSGRRQVSSVTLDAERSSGELAAFVSEP